ncbi:MAG TPA: hypothetical protein VKA34_23325 [Balneolales bacterium]|nr:hypothetical protein [Balneolales bacterium]
MKHLVKWLTKGFEIDLTDIKLPKDEIFESIELRHIHYLRTQK